MSEVKHTILYAEDDLDDLFIVQQAFHSYDGSIKVVHATNGFKAIDYLNNLKGPYPCLIILDINMPGLDGRETLVRIKESEKLKNIPVVLFTTSSSQNDRDFAKQWGAEFITKPLVYSELEVLSKVFVDKCDFEMSKRAWVLAAIIISVLQLKPFFCKDII